MLVVYHHNHPWGSLPLPLQGWSTELRPKSINPLGPLGYSDWFNNGHVIYSEPTNYSETFTCWERTS